MCVRYLYDETRGRRLTTVELVIEEAPWRGRPRKPRRQDHDLVAVRIAWDETDMHIAIKKAGGKLGRVHLVGTSIGAFTALVLAVQHPEMIRSLVLAEPPVHRWIRDTPDGAGVYREFMTVIQEPVAKAFKAGDDKGAMRIFVNGMSGTRGFDNLPPERVAAIMQNSRAMKAIAVSSDLQPNLPQEKVGRLNLPILIIAGENTIKIHKLVNEKLARLLPKAERATIPKAGHGSARENPQAFNETVLKFLARLGNQ